MNKKGFTLIELLVVIVILAIIALITVPNALAMITTAQTRADERSRESVRRAAEIYCLQQKTAPGSTEFQKAITASPNTTAVTYAQLTGANLVKTGLTGSIAANVTVVDATCTAQ